MKWSRYLLVSLVVFLVLSFSNLAHGMPSGGVYPPQFTQRFWGWYDSWGFNRNNAEGIDGYLPNVAYESLGSDRELAYSIGELFKAEYPQRVQRAEAILAYVQRWTDYGYDEDNVRMQGRPQEEWAWNADEMAHMFHDTGSVAIGDCEDMAFLCSTLYLAAGLDVVLVSPTGHVALMVWLPEYDDANYYWDIGDGRGEGWIWVEPTGERNPLGWTPPDFSDGDFDVYPISSGISISYAPSNPQTDDDVVVTVSVTAQSSPIRQVLLHYSVNGGSYRTIAMTLTGVLYKATMPRQAKGTIVKLYASATDTQGIVLESAELSYSVGVFEIPWPDIPDLEIPGFPWESILVGLVFGFMALYLLTARRSSSPMLGTTVRTVRPCCERH